MRRNFLVLLLASTSNGKNKSDRSEFLYPVLGKPIISLVLETIFKLKPEKVWVVLDSYQEGVVQEISSYDVCLVHQKQNKSEIQAVMAAKNILRNEREKDVLILDARLLLLQPETLKPLLAFHKKEGNSVTLMSTELKNPRGFRRIIRTEEGRLKIVEEREASPQERQVKETLARIYVFKIKDLLLAFSKVLGQNSTKKFDLADIVEILSQNKKKIGVWRASQSDEVIVANTLLELARAAAVLRERKIQSLAEEGVSIRDPLTTWIDLDVMIGEETVIFPSVTIEGKSQIGSHCLISPFVHIINSKIGDQVRILSSSVIEESIVEDKAQVGPFTHLRPKTIVRAKARVGNFVEMKNTVFGERSKAGHLSYLGDSEIGEDVNIGAGTITCNFDGVKKNKTIIEAGVFVGSGTELVAPVKVGRRAYIGAGSTITKNVSPEALAVARGKQIEKPGWVRRKRKK
jgi:bifunctional UDP-N-acetylglucosamine pyrophosphorylase/glucosamine-1-phosphate N-acetyltransferase